MHPYISIHSCIHTSTHPFIHPCIHSSILHPPIGNAAKFFSFSEKMWFLNLNRFIWITRILGSLYSPSSLIARTCSLQLLFAELCYVMLCYVMLCYVMLCYVMLCYVML